MSLCPLLFFFEFLDCNVHLLVANELVKTGRTAFWSIYEDFDEESDVLSSKD